MGEDSIIGQRHCSAVASVGCKIYVDGDSLCREIKNGVRRGRVVVNVV